jgi:hypothetical protein
VRFIHGVGQIIVGTPSTNVPKFNVSIADQCDNLKERFRSVPWLLDDCSSKYNNCIEYGNRRFQIKAADSSTVYFNKPFIFFGGLFTLFAYPNSAVNAAAGPVGVLALSDHNTVSHLRGCVAAARVVLLSQRLVTGGDVDIYLQATTTGSSPVKVIQGGAVPVGNAVPNWTELNPLTSTLVRGIYGFGSVTLGEGGGLSSHISNFAPGTYNLIAVPTGAPVTSPNLLPNAQVCLRANTYHTIVISDRNGQPTGYGIRVYTDGPCCCPERSPTDPIFVEPLIIPAST